MEFRRAVPADIPQLCALRRQQLIDEGQEPALDLSGPMARFFSSMMEEDRLVEFLALEGGDIVATGAVCFYPFPPSFTNPTASSALLQMPATAPAARICSRKCFCSLVGLPFGVFTSMNKARPSDFRTPNKSENPAGTSELNHLPSMV